METAPVGRGHLHSLYCNSGATVVDGNHQPSPEVITQAGLRDRVKIMVGGAPVAAGFAIAGSLPWLDAGNRMWYYLHTCAKVAHLMERLT